MFSLVEFLRKQEFQLYYDRVQVCKNKMERTGLKKWDGAIDCGIKFLLGTMTFLFIGICLGSELGWKLFGQPHFIPTNIELFWLPENSKSTE